MRVIKSRNLRCMVSAVHIYKEYSGIDWKVILKWVCTDICDFSYMPS